jgi:hypothetical protein
VLAVHVATIGSAPRAVAGSEELVLVTTFGLLEMSMWSIFTHGDLPERLQVLALMAFLRDVVAKKLHRDDGLALMEGPQDATPNLLGEILNKFHLDTSIRSCHVTGCDQS